ncbi:hypothetical protein [Bradyrhizobium sp. Ce-3]|uniref:hypothetical protein n=1 Tax=Bradyrhizobium sp. Ce-3 TaxID=2913970 RepID=UPI00283A8D9A|nr:hypothetical protein [Bradyrhizobium sp. Ce-3]
MERPERDKIIAGGSRMARAPSIVPHQIDHDTYLVLNDFGRLGRAWCETDEGTDRKTLIRRLLDDHYNHPVRIIAFNTSEGWSRDVTTDIADELRRRFVEYDEVPRSVLEFVEMAMRH